MLKLAMTVIISIILLGCGAEFNQVQTLEGGAEINVKMEISFPECADIVDDWARVECVRAASQLIIAMEGMLSPEQQSILDSLEGV